VIEHRTSAVQWALFDENQPGTDRHLVGMAVLRIEPLFRKGSDEPAQVGNPLRIGSELHRDLPDRFRTGQSAPKREIGRAHV